LETKARNIYNRIHGKKIKVQSNFENQLINKKQIIMFAFTVLNRNNKFEYHAVNNDLTIFSTTDWLKFWKQTGHYCKSLNLVCGASLKADKTGDIEIYTHPNYTKMFIINGHYESITIVEDKEVIFAEREEDPEKAYRAQFQ
jgi:hypothetical protein